LEELAKECQNFTLWYTLDRPPEGTSLFAAVGGGEGGMPE